MVGLENEIRAVGVAAIDGESAVGDADTETRPPGEGR